MAKKDISAIGVFKFCLTCIHMGVIKSRCVYIPTLPENSKHESLEHQVYIQYIFRVVQNKGQGSQELPFCKACKSICVMLSDPDKHFDIYDMSFTDPKSNSFAKVETATVTKPCAASQCVQQ